MNKLLRSIASSFPGDVSQLNNGNTDALAWSRNPTKRVRDAYQVSRSSKAGIAQDRDKRSVESID